MFLPTTRKELNKRGIKRLDVVIVSGDAYIDSPFDGAALVGKVLENAGFSVGIISQPALDSPEDLSRLGEPRLFWGVTGGCVDSMVANYTALKKKKRNDDLTPGGKNDKRPDRAVVRYSNLIRQYFKNTVPIVLGGIEASLRRIAHYDYWSDSVRRSILFDAKADYLIYGMGEKTAVELAQALDSGGAAEKIRGLCHIDKETPADYIEIPSFENFRDDKRAFVEGFREFYKNNDPVNAKGICQKCRDRYLIQNPPQYYLEGGELDAVYSLDFERDAHPYYKRMGEIKALETIRFSVVSHRGCFGECNFCGITVHQGRRVRSRGADSIAAEIQKIAKSPGFKGYISDVGGATANMYKMECAVQNKKGSCKNKRCSFPEVCEQMEINHAPQIELLRKLRKIPGVKKVFVGSGLRYDLIVKDGDSGRAYLEDIIENHVSGQMKIAPEHISEEVLAAMGKPKNVALTDFVDDFYKIAKRRGKKYFLTYYFIVAHPGCGKKQARKLERFLKNRLKVAPEQVQVFTPTPSTFSTLAYYTGIDPFSGEEIFVCRSLKEKSLQKKRIIDKKR